MSMILITPEHVKKRKIDKRYHFVPLVYDIGKFLIDGRVEMESSVLERTGANKKDYHIWCRNMMKEYMQRESLMDERP